MMHGNSNIKIKIHYFSVVDGWALNITRKDVRLCSLSL